MVKKLKRVVTYSKTLIGILVPGGSLGACGYHAPLTAEIYDPQTHPDHRVDLTPEKNVVELYQIMKDTHEVFQQCNLTYWADSGTLLGAIRNKGIIPWDDDNDVGISSKDVAQFLILGPLFSDLGYFIEKVFFGYRIVKNGTTAGVDIFLMNEKNGNFYYDRGDWGDRTKVDPITGEKIVEKVYITRDELFPLKEVDFGPVKIRVPHNPDPYLKANFRGWREVAFTYGHAGQRKFKIDLTQYPEFKKPAPLDPTTYDTLDIRHLIVDRVRSDLKCPVLDRAHLIPFPVSFDGV